MKKAYLTTAEDLGYPVIVLDKATTPLGTLPIERTATLEGSRDDAVVYTAGYRDIYATFSATGVLSEEDETYISEIFENSYLCKFSCIGVGTRKGYISSLNVSPSGCSMSFAVTGEA